MKAIITQVVLISALLVRSQLIWANPAPNRPQYSQRQIQTSRFGDAKKQQDMQMALAINDQIDSAIFGQEVIAEVLRDKLALYLDGLQTERREPVAVNLMGLPGLGKTAIIEVLAKTGFQIVKFDAQAYINKGGTNSGLDSNFSTDLENALARVKPNLPTFLVIEEIDKLPEIDQKTGAENTQSLIGTLNQILSEGKFNSERRWGPRELIDASNIFIITTMNLSPNEITSFSKEALGAEKSFYDFSISDFAHFHRWITGDTAAVPKILSRLFRPNTVSRLMPISTLVNPLDMAAYRKIVKNTVAKTIGKVTTGALQESRLEVEVSEDFIDYLNKITVYAPSGARSSVAKTDQLVRQLILFAKRIPIKPKNDKDQTSLNRPRQIKVGYDVNTDSVTLEIGVLKILKNKELVLDKSETFGVTFSPATGLFSQPNQVVTNIIPVPAPAPKDQNKILKKEIRAARFPVQGNAAKGLANFINQELFGQSRYSKLVETSMNQYMVRPAEAKTAPVSIVFAGFPGIGKSEMINLTGRYLNLPIIKINLQQYTSNAPETAGQLIGFIAEEIEKVKSSGATKYILLIEELDKVYEIDPSNGAPVDRPVMGIIKDLMNNGQAEVRAEKSYNQIDRVKIDVRDAFVAVTMNFAMDRFNFKADPRLTTLDDVVNAWKRLSTRLADLKQVLGSMFLPETVNRMISNIFILKPLERPDYEKVIAKQQEIILKDRFALKGNQSVGQIELELSPEYKEYLFNESVVPSEGARFAAKVSRNLISLDFEGALKKLPKNKALSARPILVKLGYDPETRLVSATLTTTDTQLPQESLENAYQREAELNFPPLNMTGKVPKDRLVTSLHEFGHALGAIRSGLPFESITVVPPQNSVGGFVKFRSGGQSADELIGNIYATLASRAMERIMLSQRPDQSTSVIDITAGASNDILQATKLLFNVINELGFDPQGGVIERMGFEGPNRYANFADLPHEVVTQLSLVLRSVEDTLVADFLALHGRDWYADKIYLLALQGSMSEQEFYKLIEHDYPGVLWKRVDGESPLFDLFAGKIKEERPGENVHWQESFHQYKKAFMAAVEYHLHKDEKTPPAKARTGRFRKNSCVESLGMNQ